MFIIIFIHLEKRLPMNKFFLGALLALSLSSCNDDSKNKKLELEKKELELRDKELDIEISKLRKTDSLSGSEIKRIKQEAMVAEQEQSKKVTDPALSDINNLLGYWVDAENDHIYMYFKRDGTFQFQDLNSSTEQFEMLSGTYRLNEGRLTLLYDDRKQQAFRFGKEISRIPTYYIQKDRYLMVKAMLKEE